MPNVRLALRTLLQTPFVTLVAILSLALGIGANAAIFSLFDQLLLRPLPVPEAARLVNLVAPGPKPGSNSCNQASTRNNCDDVFSYPMFRDLARDQTVFAGLAAHRLFAANLTYHRHTLSGEGLLVSGSYFPVLGLTPAFGRLFGPGDDGAPGESHIVLLSHRYWQTGLGSSRGVLNETLIVNGQPMTIVGVAPPTFDGTTIGAEPKVFVPLTMRAALEPTWKGFEDRRNYSLYLFARLRPKITIQEARASLGTQYQRTIQEVEAPLQQGLSDQTMARFRSKPLVLEPGLRGQSGIPSRAGPSMKMLLGVTAFVLVIACANIANLLLARAAARRNEMTIRLSLGATRRHLILQVLTESCLLALISGIAGLFVAQWTLNLIGSMLPTVAMEGFDWRVNRVVIAFGIGVTVGTGLLFGLFPAFHSTRPDLTSALKEKAGQPAGARSAARVRTWLATAQIALSMALLIAAGLFTKSLMNVSRVHLGVKSDHVMTFGVSPALNGYTPERTRQLFEQLEDQLAVLPGVTGVTNSLVAILNGSNWGNTLRIEGLEAGPDTDTNARFNEVGAGYLTTLGIPLITGREFARADSAGTAKVAIVNEAFVKKFNLGPNPIGKHLGNAGGPLDTEIVGFTANAAYSEVKQDVPPLYLRPYRQGATPNVGRITFYVRTAQNPSEFVPTISKLVAGLDPNLPIEHLRTLPEQIRENVFLDRLISVLSAAFAGLATLLAAIGLYGVLAYTVTQRTREFGLRMALGASPGRVRAMVLRQVGLMTAVGGPLGLATAMLIGRLAESLLYGLKGWDPVVLGGSALVLTGVALGSGWMPALRASRVEPMQALRYE